MQEGGSLKKLSSDCVCFLRGVGSKITKVRGRMDTEVKEEKAPNRHLGESETEWSREIFQLVSLPLYTPKKKITEKPQQLLCLGVYLSTPNILEL